MLGLMRDKRGVWAERTAEWARGLAGRFHRHEAAAHTGNGERILNIGQRRQIHLVLKLGAHSLQQVAGTNTHTRCIRTGSQRLQPAPCTAAFFARSTILRITAPEAKSPR